MSTKESVEREESRKSLLMMKAHDLHESCNGIPVQSSKSEEKSNNRTRTATSRSCFQSLVSVREKRFFFFRDCFGLLVMFTPLEKSSPDTRVMTKELG